MVYALKSYNNNQPYRRKDDRNVIDIIIDKFAGEASSQYTSGTSKKKSYIDKSVQKLAINSIIEGYFPKENIVRQMAIKRINKMLCITLSLLIAVVIVSYYFVISCEMKLNDLSHQTVVLNNENSDLQNKLDTLKSFRNVDQTIQQSNMLQRAGKVIETPEVTVDSSRRASKVGKKRLFNYAIGF